MASADKITITGPIGPGRTLTARVITNVNSIEFDFNAQVIRINHEAGKITNIELYTIATVTYTIATRVATVTVST